MVQWNLRIWPFHQSKLTSTWSRYQSKFYQYCTLLGIFLTLHGPYWCRWVFKHHSFIPWAYFWLTRSAPVTIFAVYPLCYVSNTSVRFANRFHYFTLIKAIAAYLSQIYMHVINMHKSWILLFSLISLNKDLTIKTGPIQCYHLYVIISAFIIVISDQ